jgi:hypothetical protein
VLFRFFGSSPQPPEEIDAVERVDVFEWRPSDGAMTAKNN